jgi:hypothetical protein
MDKIKVGDTLPSYFCRDPHEPPTKGPRVEYVDAVAAGSAVQCFKVIEGDHTGKRIWLEGGDSNEIEVLVYNAEPIHSDGFGFMCDHAEYIEHLCDTPCGGSIIPELKGLLIVYPGYKED